MTYIPNLTGVTQGTNPTTEVLASNGNQSLNVCINDPRSAFNEISVVQPLPLAQIDFVYGISSLVTTSNVQGSNATVTASGSLLRCTSNGASGASSCILNAKKFVKYRSGQGAMTRVTASFGQPAAGTQQLTGCGFALANTTTFVDFIGFGYGNASSPTTFSILWRNGATGIDTWIPQSQWNQDSVNGGTKSGMVLNPQVLNQYQIQFQSIGDINMYLENPATGRFIFVHQVPAVNYSAFPNFQNPTMQISWYSNNASSSNTIAINGASAGNFLEGIRKFCGPRGALANAPSANLALNTETMVLAIKNSTYFGTNVQNVIGNRSQIHLRGFSVSAAGYALVPGKADVYFTAPATVTFRQLRNPTSGGPTVWSAYNATDTGTSTSIGPCSNIYGQSTVSSNVNPLTGITAGLGIGFTVTIPCGGSTFIDLEQFESVAYPGDTIVFTANVNSQFNSSNVVVSTALTWNEDL
jgi:hypothetical protein